MSRTLLVRVVTPERYEEMRRMIPDLPCDQSHSRARMVRLRNGKVAENPRAEWFEIEAIPEEPHAVWYCGTKRVWRITDAWLAANGYAPEEGMAVRVCEHQIEID